MGVKAEILAITDEVMRSERPLFVYSSDSQTSAIWANDTEFNPGITMKARYALNSLGSLAAIESVRMFASLPEGEARLVVAPDANDEIYDNSYGMLFLSILRQYYEHKNPFVPIGLSGINPACYDDEIIVCSSSVAG